MKAQWLITVSILILSGPLHAAEDEGQQSREQRPMIEAPHQAGAAPWTSLKPNNHSGNFHFMVMADRAGGVRPGIFEQGLEKANLMQPDFVVSVGDLIEGVSENESQVAGQWDEFQAFLKKLDMPFFYVPGNHDLSNAMMDRLWKQRFGPTYYHFLCKNVLFLCLNTEDGRPEHIGEEQIEYVKRILAEHRDVRWTFLFLHRPLWAYGKQDPLRQQFDRIEEALRDRNYSCFGGHFHNYTEMQRRGQKYIILATTGGVSRLRGPLLGEFDHMMWVTMTDRGPMFANLMLDGIQKDDIRTAEGSEMVKELLDNLRVELTPPYINSDRFTEGQAEFRIRNTSPHPVTVTAAVGLSDPMRPTPHAFEVKVATGDSKTVVINLRTDEPVSIAELKPMRIDWTAKFDRRGQDPITLTDEMFISPDRPYEFIPDHVLFMPVREYTIPKASGPVVLDGRLDEWTPLQHRLDEPAAIHGNKGAWTGLEDQNARFDLCEDKDNLYIAVAVKDDSVFSRGGPAASSPPDTVELWLDPDPFSGFEITGSEGKDYMVVRLSPAPAGEGTNGQQADKSGMTWACAATETGYVAEVAIPHTAIDPFTSTKPWNRIQFNLALVDHDAGDDDDREVRLWWQLPWRSPGTALGSGVFRRE